MWSVVGVSIVKMVPGEFDKKTKRVFWCFYDLPNLKKNNLIPEHAKKRLKVPLYEGI